MTRLFARPWLVGLGVVPLLLLGFLAYQHVSSGFMPAMDEGGFILDYKAPPGTSLTETDRLLRQVESILRETPEVAGYSRRTGLGLGGSLQETNSGDFFVKLKPPPRRPIDAVMEEVRGRIEKHVPGLEAEFAQLMEDLIGDLTSVPQPIEVKLFAEDQALLQRTAAGVAAAIGKVPGVVDVRSGVVLAGDALDIEIDPLKAALEGVDPAAITTQLGDLLTGALDTQVRQGPKMIALRVSLPPAARERVQEIGEMPLRAPDGHQFTLKRVAAITTLTGQPEISRDDLQRMVAVTGRISGRDLGSVIHDVQAVLRKSDALPRQVSYVIGGTYEQQQTAFAGLLAVMLAALALVFLLLLYVYEQFRTAVAMLTTTLLALTAVFLGLWLTGTELNITSMMGMTMIVGIATEIFLVSEVDELPAGAAGAGALILAAKNRARPILMTTIAAILALLPLALGIGQGSAMQQPLAIAIISGLIAQLPLVLVLLPVLLPQTRKGEVSHSSPPSDRLAPL